MSLTDNVAVVALVVSLVALLLTSAQLLQQLLGTAEGYRRCAPSVIGPWAKLRDRKWNWSEFRFEVQYVTPHFEFRSDTLGEGPVRGLYGPSYNLTLLPEPTSKSLKALDKTINMKEPGNHGSEHAKYDYQGSSEKYLQGSGDPERGDKKSSLMLAMNSVAPSKYSTPRDEVQVNWLQLLGVIHRTFEAHWPKGSTIPSKSSELTNPAIAFREWNWDFMPQDLLRPLATSTLNNIILLGLRLNMQWRSLDLEKGVFIADGNGYSLSSIDVRGLGITFNFSVTGAHDVNFKCVPSKAVDKLMFGIIPGCPELVRRDFRLVSRDRRAAPWPSLSLLGDLGIGDWRLRNEIVQKRFQEPHNDLIILLSTFLPLHGCPMLFNYSPLWTNESIVSPFHFFEGRLALLESLEDRIKDAPKHEASKTLQKVMQNFNDIRRDWRHDFFDKYEDSVIEGDDNEKKMKLADACRKIFNWTTTYFQGKGLEEVKHEENTIKDSIKPDLPQNETPDHAHHGEEDGRYDWSKIHDNRTRYMDLVAAHGVMSFRAVSTIVAHFKERKKRYPVSEERRKQHRALVGEYDPREPGDHVQYSIAKEYVSSFDHVTSHLNSKAIGLRADFIEAAWWVLVLRAIVWDMPTSGDPRYGSRYGKWEGEPVPSFLYDTVIPVWIT
ncbi:hypothetical protein N0V90_012940 [Kalmusia sp. IMI 367209]|nr:hypothetical protein N0V90_012940 [Kalmusia sp. IMI 367209]